MPVENRHKAWLTFVRKALEVPINYSKDDLWQFRQIAMLENPTLVRIIDSYLELAEKSETEVSANIKTTSPRKKQSAAEMHLFDLLRERKFFPQNLDLAQFASRVLPRMRTYRFDKMSRNDIAARIIEYIETSDASNRDKLEESMREALTAMKQRPPKEAERKTFLSTWEKIIKGQKL